MTADIAFSFVNADVLSLPGAICKPLVLQMQVRVPASRRIFFLGVMEWGDGDSQVSRRRRRRTPRIIKI